MRLLHVPERSPLALQILRSLAVHARHTAVPAKRFIGSERTSTNSALRGENLGRSFCFRWRNRRRIRRSGPRYWLFCRRHWIALSVRNFAGWLLVGCQVRNRRLAIYGRSRGRAYA